MNQKHLFTAIAIVIVLIIGLFIYNNQNKPDELASNTNSIQNTNIENSNTEKAADSAANNIDANNNSSNTNISPNEPTAPDGNDIAVFEITYDGKTYTPSQLTIKNGDVVIFKNESDAGFWPASAPHPAHTAYPEFDPKKSIAAGQSWKFKFTKTGTWSYHDHINPSVFGKITVQ